MANKSVHQEYDDTLLSYFGIDEPHFLGVRSPSDEINKVLVFEDSTLYERISSIIDTPNLDETTFKTKKKAFLLPGSKTSIKRVRHTLKEHSIILINDYENADFIITHDNWLQLASYNQIINYTAMSVRLANRREITSTQGSHPTLDSWMVNNKCNIIMDSRLNEYRWKIQQIYSDYCYAITGMALEIANRVETGILDVIELDVIMKTSSNKQILTLDMINDLSRLISSSSDDDIALAAMILPTIDCDQKRHLVWTLYRALMGKLYKFNRSKDVQSWLRTYNMRDFNCYAEEMIALMHQEEDLDKESFMYLEEYARKDIQIINRNIYSFKVEIKQHYKQYLNE